MTRKRRRFTPQFKGRVALEAVQERDSLQAIARRHELHPNQVSGWKRQLLDAIPDIFATGANKRTRDHEAVIHSLHAKIGELTVERDFFSARLEALSRPQRMQMIDRDHPMGVSKQCALTGVSRSSLYYRPKGESPASLDLMKRLDELHMNDPFYGSRRMVRHLGHDGLKVGRHRVRRLMHKMEIEAMYRRPRTSVANPEHRVFPYLLRDVEVSRANQVWCADITYVPVCPRLFLPGGRDGLGDPACALVAVVEHHGRILLRQGAG